MSRDLLATNKGIKHFVLSYSVAAILIVILCKPLISSGRICCPVTANANATCLPTKHIGTGSKMRVSNPRWTAVAPWPEIGEKASLLYKVDFSVTIIVMRSTSYQTTCLFGSINGPIQIALYRRALNRKYRSITFVMNTQRSHFGFQAAQASIEHHRSERD